MILRESDILVVNFIALSDALCLLDLSKFAVKAAFIINFEHFIEKLL